MKTENSLQAINMSLRHFWRDKDHFLRLAVIPAVLLLVISLPLSDLISDIFQAEGQRREEVFLQHASHLMGYSLFYIAILAFFSTNWLRFLALGASSTGFLGTRFRLAHFRFALAMLLVIVFQSTVFNLLFLTLGRFLPLVLVLISGVALGLYFILRLSPYFLGLALDRGMKIGQAWRLSKPYQGKLFASVFLMQILLFLGEQGLAFILLATGLLNAAPHGAYFFLSFIELARLALTLNVVFIYYRRMTELEGAA